MSFFRTVVGSCCLLISVCSFADAETTNPRVRLFEVDELTENYDAEEKKALKSLPSADGPGIEFLRPEDGAAYPDASPINVRVRFTPSPAGIPPKMDTLKVVIMKGWFGKDITERVLPYVTGDLLVINDLDMSGYSGTFTFKFSIADKSNGSSVAKLSVNVFSSD